MKWGGVVGTAIIIFALFSILLYSTPARADTTIQQQNELEIDGDMDAWETYVDWSYYQDKNGNFHHDVVQMNYVNGKPLLLFNIYMYSKTADGYLKLAKQNMNIIVRNVYDYVIAFTGFEKSTIQVENCRYVVFGLSFTNPENTNNGTGWLYDTQVMANGFSEVDFYNYDYDSIDGIPISLDGGKNSSVYFYRVMNIQSNQLSDNPAIVIRNVNYVNFDDKEICFIGEHTPDLWLENVNEFFFNNNITLNNYYYSYRDAAWETGGIGVVEGNVEFLLRGKDYYYITIENSHIGVAFENDGKGEAFNNSPYVIFKNVDQDYAYNYGRYREYQPFPNMWEGVAALSSILVAIAWVREGILLFSDSPEKKQLAKEMFWKVSVGTILLAMVVLGYPAMLNLVNWVFGGG